MTDEEAIFAYIDGELEGEERERIKAKIASDPALQALVAEHRAMGDRLNRAFSSILDEPTPKVMSKDAAAAPQSPDSNIASLAEGRLHREKRRLSWKPAQWGALAATLVLGVFGGWLMRGNNAGPVAERGDQLVAAGSLETALDKQLASTQSADPKVRIGLTFHNKDGTICRSFSFEATEGVACYQGENWQLQGLLRRDDADGGAYRMASSSAIADLVDDLIVGEPMDGKQERDAFNLGWERSGKK